MSIRWIGPCPRLSLLFRCRAAGGTKLYATVDGKEVVQLYSIGLIAKPRRGSARRRRTARDRSGVYAPTRGRRRESSRPILVQGCGGGGLLPSLPRRVVIVAIVDSTAAVTPPNINVTAKVDLDFGERVEVQGVRSGGCS